MNQSVISKAQELAAVIAMSPEYISMRAAEDAAGQDEALAELMGQYNDLHKQIERMSMQENPDFDEMGELTRQMETLQEQIQSLPIAQAMQSARKNFADMMAQMNAELSKVLNPAGSQGGCGGNCAGCSGCH